MAKKSDQAKSVRKNISSQIKEIEKTIRKYAKQMGLEKEDINEVDEKFFTLSMDNCLKYIESKEKEPRDPNEIFKDLVDNGFSKKILDDVKKYLDSLK